MYIQNQITFSRKVKTREDFMKNKLKMLMALSLSVVLAACGGKGADKGEEAAADPGDVSGKISVQV